ncbi:MAG: VWA domain-containing protein [Proteobacteria bacterium]|nr:VWA domain-containing protein [Pseudomonadota bacterium]
MNHKLPLRGLKGSLHLVARALSDNLQVEVRIGGDRACTDGRKFIYLPDLPLDDEEARTLAFGYIAHESAHLLYTDFGVWKACAGHPLRRHLLNVLEDIRIELEIARRYPGCRTMIGRLVDLLVSQAAFGPADDEDPVCLLQNYMLRQLRFEVLQQEALGPLAAQTGQHLEKKMGATLKQQLNHLMYQVRDAASTQDVSILVESIVELFTACLLEEKEARKCSSPTLSSDATVSAGLASDGTDRAGHASLQDILKQILSATEDQAQKGLGEIAGQKMEDWSQTLTADQKLSTPLSITCPGAGLDDRLAQVVQGNSVSLRRRMHGLLASSARRRVQLASSGKRLSSGHLFRLAVGNTRVFEQQVNAETPAAAIQILVDRSGSMEGAALDMAMKSSAALVMSLEGFIQVAVSVAVFPYPVQGVDEGVGVLTDFNESWRQTLKRYSGLSAEGTTPLASALLWGGMRLLSRQPERRILLVMTDGVPDHGQLALSVIGDLEQAGIQVMGIGIQQDASRYFRLNRIIQDISDLPQAIFGMLSQTLVH